MDKSTDKLSEAERDLEQARAMLAHSNNYAPEEWLLLATLVGGAELVIREQQRLNPELRVPLLDQVVDDFRRVTADFTNPAFLRASGAARQRNVELFSSSR